MTEEDTHHNKTPSENASQDADGAGQDAVHDASSSEAAQKPHERGKERAEEETRRQKQQHHRELSELQEALEDVAQTAEEIGATAQGVEDTSQDARLNQAIDEVGREEKGAARAAKHRTNADAEEAVPPKKQTGEQAVQRPSRAGGNLSELRRRVMEESTMHAHDERAEEVKQAAPGLGAPEPDEAELPREKAAPASRAAAPREESQEEKKDERAAEHRTNADAEEAAPQHARQPASPSDAQHDGSPTSADAARAQDELREAKPQDKPAGAVRSPMTGKPIAKEKRPAQQTKRDTSEGAGSLLSRATPGEKDEFAAPKRSSKLSALRTYKSDIARTIKRQKSSLVNVIASEEQERITKEPTTTSQQKAKKRQLAIGYLFTGLSGVFVGVGITVLIVIVVTRESNPTIVPVRTIPEFFFTDEQKQVDITGMNRREVMDRLEALKSDLELRLGEITNLVLTQTQTFEDGGGRVHLITAAEFLDLLEARPPPPFVRSLQDTMMYGVHGFDGNQPFLVLKTTFYDNAFAGMLSWERDLNSDLAPLFGPILREESGRTRTTDELLAGNPFDDDLIRNKDVRVLRDQDGAVALLYGFVDPLTIVITTNENTFVEILTRMTSRRF